MKKTYIYKKIMLYHKMTTKGNNSQQYYVDKVLRSLKAKMSCQINHKNIMHPIKNIFIELQNS